MRVLRNTVFVRLLASFALVDLASTATFIALPLVAFDRSGSGHAFAIVMLGGSIGRLVAMPIGGVLTDRVDRRKLLLAGEASLAAILAAVVACVHWELWALLAVAQCAQNVVGSLVEPAAPALRRDVVDEADRAQSVSLMQLVQSSTLLLGPMVGTAMYAALGFGAVVAWNAVALVGSILLTCSWHHPSSRVHRTDVAERQGNVIGSAVRNTAGDIRVAAQASRRDRFIATSQVMALFTGAANGFFNVAVVPWLVGPLGLESSRVGVLVSAIGAAGIGSGIVLTRVVDRVAVPRLMTTAATGSLVFPLLLLGTPSFARLVVAFAFLGANESIWGVSLNIVRQRRIPSQLQGRIPALWQTLFLVTNVTAIAAGGFLVTSLDPRTLIAWSCACWFVMAPLTYTMARFAGQPAPLMREEAPSMDDASSGETSLAVSG